MTSSPPSRQTAVDAGGEPWSAIYRSSEPTTLVIDMPESTRDRTSPCWVQYRAAVTSENTERISVSGTAAHPAAPSCSSQAVRGPFYVKVKLAHAFNHQRT